MAVTSEVSRSGPYNGNGIATAFAYGFKIFNEGDLVVIQTSVAGIETVVPDTDYTVTGVLSDAGGEVTLDTAPSGDGTDDNSEKVTILRRLDYTQPMDLRTQGKLPAEVLERAHDRAVMLIQQVKDEASRSLRLPEGESGSETTTVLPPINERKGMSLGFDPTTGQPGAYSPLGDTTVSAAMIPVVQAATTDAARTAMGPFDEGDLALTDVATNNASTTKHGLMKKLSGVATEFLNGLGAWTSTLLSYFIESRNVAAPNATVPVHALSAAGAETNIDVAIVPKGSGGVAFQVADGTATAGNKRGARSLDAQTARQAANEVASGEGSAIIAGVHCQASHGQALAHGVKARSKDAYSRAHGGLLNAGTLLAQGEEYVATISTADATPTDLEASSGGDCVPLNDDNEAVMITAQVVGYQAGGTANAGGYVVEATAKRETGAGSVVLVGSVVVRAQENNAAWDCTAIADTSSGGVNIRVTGAAGVTIKWCAWIRVARVQRS